MSGCAYSSKLSELKGTNVPFGSMRQSETLAALSELKYECILSSSLICLTLRRTVCGSSPLTIIILCHVAEVVVGMRVPSSLSLNPSRPVYVKFPIAITFSSALLETLTRLFGLLAISDLYQEQFVARETTTVGPTVHNEPESVEFLASSTS